MLNEKAQIANIAYLYQDLPEEKAHRRATKKLKKIGYDLDRENTNKDVLTAVKGNNVHINFSGTDISNPRDIISDAALAVGVQRANPQFTARRRKTRSIIREYGDDKDYSLSGHSLGGSIALNTVAQSKSIRDRVKKVDVFNSGYTLPFHNSIKPTDKKVKRELDRKVTHHRVRGDLVSAYSHNDVAFGNLAEYTHKDKNADLGDKHSLDTFIEKDL